MSKNLYLDVNTKDLTIGDNDNLRFTENNVEFVAQKIENRLLFFLGEWYLNPDLGIPYLDNVDRRDKSKNIFVKNPDLNMVNSIFINEVFDIDEIEEIEKFETEFDTSLRKYTITWSVKITTGETVSGITEV